MRQPERRPANPCFGSGPTAKRPGWSPSVLDGALVGRSHRSAPARARLLEVIERHRRLLGIPADYRIGIMPGSDTGAFEAAMWSLLGARGVDVLVFESFGAGWLADIRDELGLEDVRALAAPYGELPDLSQVDFDRDLVFTWNGTTSGVVVPDGEWIAPDRRGLVLCDATSAVFAVSLPWDKLDVVTWSWQKVLGGEAQHGMLVLSPRAIERLASYSPKRPIPKLFRFAKKGRPIEGIFRGDTINTPSMLAVEDVLDALGWVETIGGLSGTIARSRANLDTVSRWVERTPWIDFLARRPEIRSSTSICLSLVDPRVAALPEAAQREFARRMAARLDRLNVAHDIEAYREAPPGLRLWGGATVQRDDLEALLPWLEWAFAETVEHIAELAA
ncbi:Phosphoserine aminotransferase [bacterium HR40]|nr:Phosphoserine aminotransferase [bacterium HR40]